MDGDSSSSNLPPPLLSYPSPAFTYDWHGTAAKTVSIRCKGGLELPPSAGVPAYAGPLFQHGSSHQVPPHWSTTSILLSIQ
ncbi:hypothetical protein E2C01_034042 [Portunus trituberculatus]|uniref:Uncharacterized protein n=1 Tax=Portunus trituberculatus TaxID=210409 RepID=A0A5B7F1R8_PORTR|nr:hypothetical protein [Portunus trituberculatus]